jgi:transcription antitermination protein NusB
MKRNQLREYLMNCIYQMDISQDYSMDCVNLYIEDIKSTESSIDEEYLRKNIRSFLDNKAEIDELVSESLKNWKIDRISKVDLAVLRLAITEILFENDVPYKVSINEAINIAKKFGDNSSGKFINGVLGKIVKSKGLE